jgi:bifunctional enzyme CysN/CysC
MTANGARKSDIAEGESRGRDVFSQQLSVSCTSRSALKGQDPAVLWFTGLSGSGKSTIANLVEARLIALHKHTYLIDGDNVRHGLSGDLSFSDEDRSENIRRVGEVAKLMTDAGLIVIVALISPLSVDRATVRRIVDRCEFLEIFVDTPFEECARRDPKGLYARAIRGEIRNFTGIDSPYQAPARPEIHLKTLGASPDDLSRQVEDHLRRNGLI